MDNGTKILTISVAAYNVEDTIREALDSITSSSLRDEIEVLVINDGSVDSTSDIVGTYEERYPGIVRLVNKDNGGYGSTVNTSIDAASGRYFKLIDGDDWVDSEGLDKLVAFLAVHDVDMVVTKYVIVNPQTGAKRVVEGDYLFCDEVLPFDENCSGDVVPMHQLAFRTEVLRESGTKLMHGVPYTDAEFCIMPIPCVDTVAFVDAVVYCYRLGNDEQSVSIPSWQRHLDKGICVTFDMIDFYNDAARAADKLTFPKRDYIRRLIVGSLVNKYLLFLTYKPSMEVKARLLAFDEMVLEYEDEWRDAAAEVNPAVRLLLESNFILYAPLSLAYRAKLKHSGRL